MRTELPKEWAIKITKENKYILKKYRKNISGIDLDYPFKGYLLSDLDWDISGLYWGGIQFIELDMKKLHLKNLNV